MTVPIKNCIIRIHGMVTFMKELVRAQAVWGLQSWASYIDKSSDNDLLTFSKMSSGTTHEHGKQVALTDLSKLQFNTYIDNKVLGEQKKMLICQPRNSSQKYIVILDKIEAEIASTQKDVVR